MSRRLKAAVCPLARGSARTKGVWQVIVFDIETGPLPEEQVLANAAPFDPPKHPGIFDPASVKLGQLKDQAKIETKIAEKRAAHEKAIAEFEADLAAAESQWKANAIARAALSAMTGQVVAIGFQNGSGAARILIDEEPKLLAGFWRLYQQCREKKTQLVGHNIFGFDLPFLIRRSWLLQVDVPGQVFDGRYFDRIFVDTMKYWQLGTYGGDPAKLDAIDRYFGGGGKNGDGAMFAELLKINREAAVEYLKNDLVMTARVAARMGVI